MTIPQEIWHLPTTHIAQRVLVYSQIDSTNSLALAHDDPADNLAFLADEQTSGRGQHGRRWLARPRSSVLLSVRLQPPPAIARPAILTAWAAVSVYRLAQSLTPGKPRIKWPNDVLLDERKVCGILIEQRQGPQPATVVGIGLNVTQTEQEFDDVGLPLATSLQARGAQPTTTHEVARQLLRLLDEEYDRLLAGDFLTLEQTWRPAFGLLGRHIEAETLSGPVAGKLTDLSFSAVNVELPGGQIRSIPPEAVLHLFER